MEMDLNLLCAASVGRPGLAHRQWVDVGAFDEDAAPPATGAPAAVPATPAGPPGGRRRWNVRPLTAAQEARGRAHVRKWSSPSGAQSVIDRFWRCIEMTHGCRLRPEDGISERAMVDLTAEEARRQPERYYYAVIGQWLEDELGAGTQKTYFGYLGKVCRRVPYHRINRALHLAAADSDGRTARDVTAAEILAVAGVLEGKARCIYWFLVLTAARLADAARLRRGQLAQANLRRKKKLLVQWRVTKHLRRRALRTTSEHDVGAGTKKVPADVWAYWLDGPSGVPLFSCATNKFNAVLRAACDEAKVGPMTSYSLRRFAINRMFEEKDGDVLQVQKETTHLRASTLLAFYKRSPFRGHRPADQ